MRESPYGVAVGGGAYAAAMKARTTGGVTTDRCSQGPMAMRGVGGRRRLRVRRPPHFGHQYGGPGSAKKKQYIVLNGEDTDETLMPYGSKATDKRQTQVIDFNADTFAAPHVHVTMLPGTAWDRTPDRTIK